MSGLIALALLVAGAQTEQLPTKSVSFERKSGTARNLLNDLSQVSGVRLGASAETANDYLAISFTNQPLNEVMARIAQADSAEWKQESTGWYLVRSNPLAQRQENAEMQLRMKAIAAEQAKLRSRPRPPALNSESAAALAADLDAFFNQSAPTGQDVKIRDKQMEALVNRNPGSYAMTAAVASIDPALLARPHQSFRLVFSSDPTPEQLPLPDGVQEIVSSYIRDFKLLVQAYYDRNNGQKPTSTYYYDNLGSPVYRVGDLKNGIGKIHLIANGNNNRQTIQFALTVSDADGKLVDQNSIGINYEIEPEESRIAERDGESRIQLSDLAMELAKSSSAAAITLDSSYSWGTSDATGSYRLEMAGNSNLRRNQGVSAQLRKALLDPVNHDPMSFAAAEAFLQSAQIRKDNLIAALPDSMFSAANTLLRGAKLTPSAFLRSREVCRSMKVEENGGWLLGSPCMPYHESEYRVDREALGRLLAVLESQGSLGLDDLAKYSVTALEPPIGNGPDAVYLRIVNPALIYGDDNFREWPMLRLYGSLSLPERQALLSGVPYQNMGKDHQAAVSSLVYSYFDGPEVQGTDGKAENLFGTLGERTDVLPKGVPGSTALLEISNQSTGVLGSNSVLGGNQLLTPTKLATYMIQADRPELVNALGVAPAFDRFKPFSVTTLTFKFNFQPGVSMERKLIDSKPANGADYVAFANLPEDFKAAVDEQYKTFKAHFFQGGGTKPPAILATK